MHPIHVQACTCSQHVSEPRSKLKHHRIVEAFMSISSKHVTARQGGVSGWEEWGQRGPQGELSGSSANPVPQLEPGARSWAEGSGGPRGSMSPALWEQHQRGALLRRPCFWGLRDSRAATCSAVSFTRESGVQPPSRLGHNNCCGASKPGNRFDLMLEELLADGWQPRTHPVPTELH